MKTINHNGGPQVPPFLQSSSHHTDTTATPLTPHFFSTLWRPLLPYGYSIRAERQSARMSKTTNGSLTRSGTGCFIAVVYPYGNSVRQRVKKKCGVVLVWRELLWRKFGTCGPPYNQLIVTWSFWRRRLGAWCPSCVNTSPMTSYHNSSFVCSQLSASEADTRQRSTRFYQSINQSINLFRACVCVCLSCTTRATPFAFASL